MSCSTSTSRAPSGSRAMAWSRSMPRSTDSPTCPLGLPAPGLSNAAGDSTANTRCSRRRVARRSVSTRFTVSRWSQVDSALSPRKVDSRRHACTNTSCVRSSASRRLPVSRRHNAYTRPTSARYRAWKAASSPAAAGGWVSASLGAGVGRVMSIGRRPALEGLGEPDAAREGLQALLELLLGVRDLALRRPELLLGGSGHRRHLRLHRSDQGIGVGVHLSGQFLLRRLHLIPHQTLDAVRDGLIQVGADRQGWTFGSARKAG